MGLAENTIFIFMTDNGSAGGVAVDEDQFVSSGYNAGMRGQKGSEYDGGHRVPFFLHWPAGGISAGRDVDEVTANVDVLPTLIEMCGLDDSEPDSFDGRSLARLLQPEGGEETVWPDRALVTDSQRLAYPVKWRKSAVMTGRWRLVNGRRAVCDSRMIPGSGGTLPRRILTSFPNCAWLMKRGGRRSRVSLTKTSRSPSEDRAQTGYG